ncbi:MAG: TetR/AcrR family transcriptional regulator [Streptococcaceae bacterium]|jgi:AcrR family transcriptional regulator|nr:TetR/AcrR family transcriptional regulator [Streptococcaceae bacterium]
MNQTEKKKAAILATTFNFLSNKEITNITVDEIAEKAEVSKVTIFKYYGSKNQLMNTVIMRAFEHMAEEIESIIQSELGFEATYEAITKMKLDQLERYSEMFSQNLMTQYSQDPDFFNADAVNAQMKVYNELFEKGQAEGKIASDLTKADFLFIINIFIRGMKGLSAQELVKHTRLINRFFINGFA